MSRETRVPFYSASVTQASTDTTVMFQIQNFCYSFGFTALKYIIQLSLRQLILAVYESFSLSKLFHSFYVFTKRIYHYEIVLT
jgi:hypothetical protein